MNIYNELKPQSLSEIHLTRYCKLIHHYTSNPTQCKYEKHHILPKSLFPEYATENFNIVYLPIRAHFIAHFLLHKICAGKMTQAYFMMCNRLDRKSSKSYLEARAYQSSHMMGNKNYSPFITSNPNFDGKQAKEAWAKASPERREKQSFICASNNTKFKSKPKNIRFYECDWCYESVERVEFSHRPPKDKYFCGATCRNRHTNSRLKIASTGVVLL